MAYLLKIDDLFHAMEYLKPQIIDGTVLNNRHNRQKRPTGRYLRAKCGQNYNQVAEGLIRVGSAQLLNLPPNCAAGCCTNASGRCQKQFAPTDCRDGSRQLMTTQ
jgi:hypothetical protein